MGDSLHPSTTQTGKRARADTNTGDDTFRERSRSRRRSIEARHGEDDGKDEDNNVDGDAGNIEAMRAHAKPQRAREEKGKNWVEKPIRIRIKPRACMGCSQPGYFSLKKSTCKECGAENDMYFIQI